MITSFKVVNKVRIACLYPSVRSTRRISEFSTESLSVLFRSWDEGKETKIVDQVKEHETLLDIAQSNGVPLEGACEGSLSCSTCHVIFEHQDQFDQFPEPTEDELDMLDVAHYRTNLSRLGCCVKTIASVKQLDIRLPPSTVSEIDSFDVESSVATTSDNDGTSIQHKNKESELIYQNMKLFFSKYENSDIKNKPSSKIVRMSEISVPIELDPGVSDVGVCGALHDRVCSRLGSYRVKSEHITVVRKSLDARRRRNKTPSFVYVVDVDLSQVELNDKLRKYLKQTASAKSLDKEKLSKTVTTTTHTSLKKKEVFIVGAGPAGLFAALKLAQSGNVKVTLFERGEAVERRGADIGAMYIKRLLKSDSNMLFGIGGAGTWSDGKLTTRIGKNSSKVTEVLEALVVLGAPANILQLGKPHLGTDRMIKILRNMRTQLELLGVNMVFGERVESIKVENGRVSGLVLSSGTPCPAERVILGIGHSARDVFERMYLEGNVEMKFQPFSVGLRGEHPQEIINDIRYGASAVNNTEWGYKLPVADYRLVARTDTSGLGGSEPTAAYSFCMCPGGQVVPTALTPHELCVNGMSFSKRSSNFANSGLVVPISEADCAPFTHRKGDGVLDGLLFQRKIEQAAAIMGGGNLVAPVQLMTDFLEGKALSPSLEHSPPPSSYRLGVRSAELHEIYPPQITEALRQGLLQFNEDMPGYLSSKGVLHGVETRTSSPVKIVRDPLTLHSPSVRGLFPVGEGAGYAGGIVSAAVDGARAASMILDMDSYSK